MGQIQQPGVLVIPTPGLHISTRGTWVLLGATAHSRSHPPHSTAAPVPKPPQSVQLRQIKTAH